MEEHSQESLLDEATPLDHSTMQRRTEEEKNNDEVQYDTEILSAPRGHPKIISGQLPVKVESKQGSKRHASVQNASMTQRGSSVANKRRLNAMRQPQNSSTNFTVRGNVSNRVRNVIIKATQET